jgi:hypothetical protein
MTVGDCKMDFPIVTRIPSFENSFWIKLPDSIITVDVNTGTRIHDPPFSSFGLSRYGCPHTTASSVLNP